MGNNYFICMKFLSAFAALAVQAVSAAANDKV